METIIINSDNGKTSGVIECSKKDNKLTVCYNLTSDKSKRIMRLRGLSSKKPHNFPLRIDVPIFERGRAQGKKEISAIDLGMQGYNARDIDTFVLTYEDKCKTEVAATGFEGLIWDISYSIGRISETKSEEPLRNTEKLLNKLKLNKENKSSKNKIIDAIYAAEKLLCKTGHNPCEKYRWYSFSGEVYPFGLGIFRHITENLDCHREEALSDRLLVGVGAEGHAVLAIEKEGKNPFKIAEDCAVFKDGYWLVGVSFKDDGQYFERI